MDERLTSEPCQRLLKTLRDQPASDQPEAWPATQLRAMVESGLTQWDIPAEYGGQELSAVDLTEALRQLAACCLTSTFVWTQRIAAVRRIVTSSNTEAKARLLPGLLSGETFATVGISHLTTSGQHLCQPMVQVDERNGGFVFQGKVPWATGATQANVIVTGGTLSDGRQVLACLPTNDERVVAKKPAALLALNASQTGTVELNDVEVSAEDILHGPMDNVMKHSTGGGAGSLGTSALAIGAAAGSIDGLRQEVDRRAELAEYLNPLREECDQLSEELSLATRDQHHEGPAAAESIRRRANSLALRSAQAWLAATKGAGFVAGHPAERAVRESLFFLVWSCPQPVLNANLAQLTCSIG